MNRAQIAAMAMQGLLASDIRNESTIKEVVEDAVKIADALIKELKKKPRKK